MATLTEGVPFGRQGDNVLHYAVMCQKMDMIKKLLRLGLDPTVATPGGVNGSPLDLAKKETSSVGMQIYELLTRRVSLWVGLILTI